MKEHLYRKRDSPGGTMLHKPITLFQALALYTAHSLLNSPILAAYISGLMSN